MDGQEYVLGHGWKYVDTDSIYAEARKAMDWYECTGMKVAKNPAMPRLVAQWILWHVKPVEVDNGETQS